VNDLSDAQLLRDYAERGGEAAFREIVERHTDLLYSAALRQVESADLAADITQSVFTDLARKARTVGSQLPPNASLAGWLHRATRYAALNHWRTTQRRLANERQAMEQLLTNSESPADWGQIRPGLDEALDSLNDEDREALLLRYFRKRDFRAVGLALGISDDAAQKRVSRALERLREFFTRRNVTIGASGLAVLISANAVQSAPIGLVATISAAAVLTGTAISTATVIAATKTIAMTTLQKTLITAALATTIGTGVFEAHQAAQLRAQNQILQQEQAPLTDQVRQLQNELSDATNQLASLIAENGQLQSGSNRLELLKLRGEVAALQRDASDPTAIAAKELVAKVNKLKERLEEMPNAKIPEMQFLTEKDWLSAANGNLNTDMDYRRALSKLRSIAQGEFVAQLKPALNQYMQANNGQFPTDLSQLQPYFAAPVDDAILQRWEITTQATVPSIGVGQNGMMITETAAVDDIFDTRDVVSSDGTGQADFLDSEERNVLPSVYKNYMAANGGQEPANMSQMLPYATTPEQQSAVQKMILRASLNK
jgi:RNA polymerase sigma factor (sigma-70 family)